MNNWVRAIFKSGGFLWVLIGLYLFIGKLKPAIDIISIIPTIKDNMPSFMIISGVVMIILYKRNLSLKAEIEGRSYESRSSD